MKRNQIQHICIHLVPPPDGRSVAERINRFHVQLIERRLNQSELEKYQKMEIVERIIQKIKLNE